MANPEFVALRKSKDQRLGHLVEEFGEVLSAVGKIMSFGWFSVNPLIPEAEQETNIDWLMRELDDVELAIRRLREKIAEEQKDALAVSGPLLVRRLVVGVFEGGYPRYASVFNRDHDVIGIIEERISCALYYSGRDPLDAVEKNLIYVAGSIHEMHEWLSAHYNAEVADAQ